MMNILHISDTHGLHRELGPLPNADLCIHSGDCTMGGTLDEAEDFIDWFCDLPYPNKVFIAGNHDFCLRDAQIEGLDNNTFFLNNELLEIEGLKVYGMPMSIEYDEEYCRNQVGQIPAQLDILITHQPPFGILDHDEGRHWGSSVLLEKILQVRPRLHLFGHIHNDNGSMLQDGMVFSNAAIVDGQYRKKFIPRVLSL